MDKHQPIYPATNSQPSRLCLRRRLTGFLALSLLMFNLLASALSSPMNMDISQAAICTAQGMALPQGDDNQPAPSSNPARQDGANCVFCLPLLHAGQQPKNIAYLTHLRQIGEPAVPPADIAFVPQPLPPGKASPRAPPSLA